MKLPGVKGASFKAGRNEASRWEGMKLPGGKE